MFPPIATNLAPTLLLHQPVVLDAIALEVAHAVIAPGIARFYMGRYLTFFPATFLESNILEVCSWFPGIPLGIFTATATTLPKLLLASIPIFPVEHFRAVAAHE